MTDPVRQTLRDVFGYERFRGNQEAIIEAVLTGRDALVLMPTGGGKSLYYQVPALIREEQADVIGRFRAGDIQLLYIAPERLVQPQTLSWLADRARGNRRKSRRH